MNVFLSSVIRGYEHFREAATTAVRMLGFRVIQAEDFKADPASPQQVCLEGVRQADVMILLLGRRYGYMQSSDLSATHEEYLEARKRIPVFVFVERVADREPEQEQLIREIQSWDSGHYTAEYDSPEELQAAVTQALHKYDISIATGPVDAPEMLERASQLLSLPCTYPSISIAVSSGPRQAVLRPAKIDAPDFVKRLQQKLLFGEPPLFNLSHGLQPSMQGSALILEQLHASLYLDELGSIRIQRPAYEESERTAQVLPVLIQEDVQNRIEHALRFIVWLLDEIDPIKRITHIVILAALQKAGYLGWKTLAEHSKNPHSSTIGLGDESIVVYLTPPHRSRAELSLDAHHLAEDLTVLLRRKMLS